ncbi:MAG: phage major capsid protein [Alphaproteobacteria bacterium]|nr:phage major capsid protein [Alphaproteobacteria bacterium]MBU4136889.1 phage major capsid protein [Alphaproteobacteria bacterium]
MQTATARPAASFRGVSAVRNGPRDADPATILNGLADAFGEFKERHNAEIDGINARLAAATIGGAPVGTDTPAGVRAAQESFGRFAKTGVAPMAAMSTDDNSKGGYLVQPELEKVITRRQADLSPMRRLARVQTTTSGEYQIPMADGGVESGWTSERGARPETDAAALAMLTIVTGEIYANPAITQKMLDDAVVDIGAYLADEITLAFEEKEGDAFVNGDGINKPRGFLQYPSEATADATRPRGTLEFKETAGTGVIAPDDLINLLYNLRAGYRAGSVWLMNSETAGVVRKLKDADGNHIWSLATTAGELPMLLGYPVEIDEGMPAIANGAYPVAFGNFQRGYIVVDRTGIRVLRDDLTNKPYVHFYTTKRVGGAVHDGNAIKLLKIKS